MVLDPTWLTLATKVAEAVRTRAGAGAENERAPAEGDEKALEMHLREVINWSTQITMPMMEVKETDNVTVALRMQRDYRHGDSGEAVNEDDLLTRRNVVLSGPAGSGKTTTVKRLALRLLEAPKDASAEDRNYPLVIRLKELQRKERLVVHVAKKLGIGFEAVTIRTRSDALRGGSGEAWAQDQLEYYAKERLLVDAVADYLETTRPLVFLDGLDELDHANTDSFYRDLQALAQKTPTLHAIVTCRSGEYDRHIEGFSRLRIAPLTDSEVRHIAGLWLEASQADQLLERLRALPYKDLVDRPLFLCNLVTLFSMTGVLPEAPIEVYRGIVSLSLERWDRHRGVKRTSKYASMTIAGRLAFLAALSFNLTYRMKSTRFKRQLLERCYLLIYDKFGLPVNEVDQVVNELEAHTGLLLQTGYDYYEFSHLSIQEFLCAEYLSRSPLSGQFLRYLKEYPAPVAIAIALSSEPSRLFAGLVLLYVTTSQVPLHTWKVLLLRMQQERPRFERLPELGGAILSLIFVRHKEIFEAIMPFLRSPNVRDSVLDAVAEYRRTRTQFSAEFELRKGAYQWEVRPREKGFLPFEIFNQLAHALDLQPQDLYQLQRGRDRLAPGGRHG